MQVHQSKNASGVYLLGYCPARFQIYQDEAILAQDSSIDVELPYSVSHQQAQDEKYL